MYLARFTSGAKLGKQKPTSNSTNSISKQTQNLPKKSQIQATAKQRLQLQSQQQQQQQNNQQRNSQNVNQIIDKILNDAIQTGDLNLCRKNLYEFPKYINLYGLIDTLNIDLSSNQLIEFPKELCIFIVLETLYLQSNQIHYIPETVNNLKLLKILDLNCNKLTHLPVALCELKQLEVLNVNNNKLVSLPEEIYKLEKLIQLDVSCNEITHLPVQIGNMKSLRVLNVRRNMLVELPKEISKLNQLVNFDCSFNRLKKLPLTFRDLITLIDLNVDNNPLDTPPSSICSKGLLHIMKYLLNEAIKEEKKIGILSDNHLNGSCNNSNNNTSSNSFCNGIVNNELKRSSTSSNHNNNSSNLVKTLNGLSIEEQQQSNNNYEKNINAIIATPPPLSSSAVVVVGAVTSAITTNHHNNETDRLHTTRQLDRKMHEEQLAILEKQRYETQKVTQQMFNGNSNSKSLVRRLTIDDHYHYNHHNSTFNEKTDQNSTHKALENRSYKSLNCLNSNNNGVMHNEANLIDYNNIMLNTANELNDWDVDTVDLIDDANNDYNGSNGNFNTDFEFINGKSIWSNGNGNIHHSLEELDLTNTKNPAYTMRRHIHQAHEELKQIEFLKNFIETKLKILLPDDISVALADGVILCHLINHLFPRAIQIIHIPSLAVPKLSLAKCRKNIENFIDACYKFGLAENDVCCAQDIIEAKNTPKIARTIMMIVKYNQEIHNHNRLECNLNGNQQQQQQTAV